MELDANLIQEIIGNLGNTGVMVIVLYWFMTQNNESNKKLHDSLTELQKQIAELNLRIAELSDEIKRKCKEEED